MILQGVHVGGSVFGWDALIHLDNNIGEAIWIQINFLMIWDLTDCAVDTLESFFDGVQIYQPDICESSGQVGDESSAKQLSRVESRHFDL